MNRVNSDLQVGIKMNTTGIKWWCQNWSKSSLDKVSVGDTASMRCNEEQWKDGTGNMCVLKSSVYFLQFVHRQHIWDTIV